MKELLFVLLALACPLMMILMMRGHAHGHAGDTETVATLRRRVDELERSLAADTPRGYSGGVDEITYSVPELSCEHCRRAVASALGPVTGVDDVSVDLELKKVAVRGRALDDGALRAALAEAGYEAAA